MEEGNNGSKNIFSGTKKLDSQVKRHSVDSLAECITQLVFNGLSLCPPPPPEKVVQPRERDGKLLRRDAPPRDLRGLPGERGGPIPFRPRDAAAAATPKSPK